MFASVEWQAQHQATLNKAIRRIIRDCNDEQFEKSEEPEVLLPHFSCHSLRHTFTTRMCEAGVNIKVIQDALGHSDISTTLNIYADVTKEMDCQHFFRQIFLGYFSDIVQAFDTLRTNVCGDDYTSLHNPIVLSSVLPAYGMFHSIQILFL